MLNDTLKLKGKYIIKIHNEDGSINRIIEKDNLIMDVGKAIILNNLMNNETTPSLSNINYVAFGTGTTQPTSSQTQLVAETYRIAFTSSAISGNTINFTIILGGSAGPLSFNEIGVFVNATNVANSGIMFSRQLLNISRTSGQTLTIIYQLTLV